MIARSLIDCDLELGHRGQDKDRAGRHGATSTLTAITSYRARHKMSPSPTGSTEARPVVVKDNGQSFQERLQALEEREWRVLEAERLAHDSGCRILMDGKMVPVFTLEAEVSCNSLERPVASASREDLQRVLLRICSVSKVARAITTEMLPITTESTTSTIATGSKRKASDAEMIYRCSRCKLRFETDENLPKDCIYHPGERIPMHCAAKPHLQTS